MKKILAAVLALTIVFALVACNKPKETSSNVESDIVQSDLANTEFSDVQSAESLSSKEVLSDTEAQSSLSATSQEPSQTQNPSSTNTTSRESSQAQTLSSTTATSSKTETSSRPVESKISSSSSSHSHSFSAATCTEPKTCTVCKLTDGSMLGHSYGAWKEIKAATETTVGKEERICANCNNRESREIPKIIKGHSHKYASEITKSATCQAYGVKTFTCSCGAKYTENLEKTSHQYTENIIAPSCTSDGYTTHTCQVCGYYYTNNKTSATGHKDIKNETTQATCGTDGSKKEVCGVCKATVKNTVIPATDQHNYVAKTCSDAFNEVVQNNRTLFVENIASYQHKTDWMCNICSVCHQIKQGSEGDIWSMYSDEEQSKIMLGYVNELRKQYKADNPGFYNIINDKVELVYDAKLTELANIRAKEISTSYSHDTGTRTFASECIAHGYDTLHADFIGWKNSPRHFDGMVMKKGVRFGYGRYIDHNGIPYSCLLIWDKYWSAEMWEIKYG